MKHALVRDSAYESLLRSRRQELHGKIARVIEERFPTTENTEPELLAHHYTEAKLPEKAIPLWHKAGKLAPKRMALTEAIRHLEKGLDLVATLPSSVERDSYELDLRTSLGTAWMALEGWHCQEVWASLRPALDLANSLHRKDALLPILWGLFIHVVNKGHLAESRGWVNQIARAAQDYQDADLSIVAHTTGSLSSLWLGELIEARREATLLLEAMQRGATPPFG